MTARPWRTYAVKIRERSGGEWIDRVVAQTENAAREMVERQLANDNRSPSVVAVVQMPGVPRESHPVIERLGNK